MIGMRMHFGRLVAATAFFAATATASAIGSLAQGPGTTELVNYGTTVRPRCEDADEEIVHGLREAVCYTYVLAIDGKAQSRWSRLKEKKEVPLGIHLLRIFCAYSVIGPQDRGAVLPQTTEIELEATFLGGTRYYLHGNMEDDHCKLRIDETPPGPPTSILKSIF